MSLPDKFSAFYGTQSFISMCARACYWSLSSDRGHVNILPLSKWRLPFRLLHLYCTCIFRLVVRVTYAPSFAVLYYHLASVQLGAHFFKFPIMQFVPSDSSSILSPNCLFCIHFLSTPPPSVSRWQVSYPYRTTCKIIVLYMFQPLCF